MRTHRTCLAALILIAASQIYAAAPSVTPLSPTQGGFTASATPALTFSIQSDAAIVTLSAVLDGALISATHNTNGTWSLNPANLTDGSHCYTITTIDTNNQPGSAIVTFYNDLSHPVVTITSPSNLQTVVGPDVHISGTFSGLNHRQIEKIIFR